MANDARKASVGFVGLGAKARLDPQGMIDIIGRTSGNSAMFPHAAPGLIARDVTGIGMNTAIKGREMETQLAMSLAVPCLMTNTVPQVCWIDVAALGGGAA